MVDINSILYYSTLHGIAGNITPLKRIQFKDSQLTKQEKKDMSRAKEIFIQNLVDHKIKEELDSIQQKISNAYKGVVISKKEPPVLKLYYWCWAEHQNKINNNNEYVPYDKETGTQKIIDELKYHHTPEKLADFVQIWRDLDKVSFRYAMFCKNEVVIYGPSRNVQNVGKNCSIYISYNINGRYCPHRLLMDIYRDPDYKCAINFNNSDAQ